MRFIKIALASFMNSIKKMMKPIAFGMPSSNGRVSKKSVKTRAKFCTIKPVAAIRKRAESHASSNNKPGVVATAITATRSVASRDASPELTKGTMLIGKLGRALALSAHSRMQVFLRLLDSPLMQRFFSQDPCMLLSDRYLIAMAFVYMERIELKPSSLAPPVFLQCLYLAYQMEEEEEDIKDDIINWVTSGSSQSTSFKIFQRGVWHILRQLNYSARVEDGECVEVMSLSWRHPAWKRARHPSHAINIREHQKAMIFQRSGPSSANKVFCQTCTLNYPVVIPKTPASSHAQLGPRDSGYTSAPRTNSGLGKSPETKPYAAVKSRVRDEQPVQRETGNRVKTVLDLFSPIELESPLEE